MKKSWLKRGVLCLVLLFAAVSLPAGEAAAASYPKINAVAKKKRKKAPEIKLDQIYKVVHKKNKSMIRFTAKKKGTYVFTIAKLRSGSGAKAVGDFCIYRDSVAGLIPMTVKTQGGKAKIIRIAAANTYKKGSSYLKKRMAKLKLKKGMSYLLELDYTSKKGKTCAYLVKVEKK